jgi:Flp pilus assembly protein TadG
MGHARRGRGGQSLVEFMMIAPMFLFLFIGAFDWGFFAHGLISTENGARVGALYYVQAGAASVDTGAAACKPYVLQEMRTAVNIGASLTTCTALPVIVTASKITGPDGAANGAVKVTVEYQTQNLIPIPGLLNSQYTFYRVVKMKL